MVLRGCTPFEAQTATASHIFIGKQIQGFLTDCGEECDVVLEFDEVDGPFSFLFTGTTLSLAFEGDSISVMDFDLDNDEEKVLQVFETGEVNKATHWLLTQVNQAKQSS